MAIVAPGGAPQPNGAVTNGAPDTLHLTPAAATELHQPGQAVRGEEAEGGRSSRGDPDQTTHSDSTAPLSSATNNEEELLREDNLDGASELHPEEEGDENTGEPMTTDPGQGDANNNDVPLEDDDEDMGSVFSSSPLPKGNSTQGSADRSGTTGWADSDGDDEVDNRGRPIKEGGVTGRKKRRLASVAQRQRRARDKQQQAARIEEDAAAAGARATSGNTTQQAG